MNIFSICGAVLICLIFIICFGKTSAKSGLIVGIGLCLMLLVSSLDNLIPIFDYLKQLINMDQKPLEHLSILIKSTGIALISSFTSHLCKSCNEESIASGVEFFAKTEIIVLCLPVIRSLLDLATNTIG